MYGLDFIAFKGILETLIKTVRTENKKKAEKLKLEETKLQEEKPEEQEENDFLLLKANEDLSPLINYGLTTNKDVINFDFLDIKEIFCKKIENFRQKTRKIQFADFRNR